MTNQEHTAPDKNKIKILWTAGLALCLMVALFFAAAALAGKSPIVNFALAALGGAGAVFCAVKTPAAKKRFTTREIAFIGMMGAIVFVSNYISFTIPLAIGGDITRVHVANAFCLLAGLSLGPVAGGLSAGIGSMLYDLTIPQFIAGSPFTFAFKFIMAYVAGIIAGGGKKSGSSSAKIIAGGVAGQVCYIVLYIGKKFITYYFLHKEPLNVTIAACATSLLTSLTNAVIAVVIACLLAPVFRKVASTQGGR